MRLSFQAIENWPLYSNDLAKISPNVEQEQWLSWQQSNQLYVAIFNQRVVAYCVLSETDSLLQISKFIVRDVTQRRGIGLFMFQQLLQVSKNRQLTGLQFPHSNDPVVLSFYQHLGLNNQFIFQL
ncbi:hypothetical protein AHAT_21800 [Agarivorans sp. Toyoura001]|uniref:acetyl-CoA sensor PanZ family protein n=1 Tax=Agarivorans sp. Toyoura001 TaxID=2283141 RepID=UPI0010F3981B|nr:acetyl-CoA sensor PanZ family protein [Agarivorans sp. Toyoura001]GDY26290.1 hypothetical protein AHAT_21800 [Agarivorans sp. Toyoura001]